MTRFVALAPLLIPWPASQRKISPTKNFKNSWLEAFGRMILTLRIEFRKGGAVRSSYLAKTMLMWPRLAKDPKIFLTDVSRSTLTKLVRWETTHFSPRMWWKSSRWSMATWTSSKKIGPNLIKDASKVCRNCSRRTSSRCKTTVFAQTTAAWTRLPWKIRCTSWTSATESKDELMSRSTKMCAFKRRVWRNEPCGKPKKWIKVKFYIDYSFNNYH